MSETPRQAARRLAQPWIAQGYVPEALHVYRFPDGRAWYSRIRLKRPDDDKIIRPMRLNGHGFEMREPEFPATGKPIYSLHKIAAVGSGPVWIVEGEKPADALSKLGAVATTSGGAQSAAAADWTPLRGRECRLWADNDDAGKGYMGEVAAILQGLGCKLSAVDVDALELPPKGDAADWVQAHPGATLADLETIKRTTARTETVDVSDASAHSANTTAGNLTRRDDTEVILTPATAIEMRPVRWLWDGFLAAGKLHMLAGAPGTGKTTLVIALAAIVTRGGEWPDRSRCREPGDVLIWSGEDDPADTLKPRLVAAGADMSRVQFVNGVRSATGMRTFDPAQDMPDLELAIARSGLKYRFLMVDPVVSAVAGDSHKNAEVRRGLQPIVTLAQRLDVAAIGISHYSKGTAGKDPVERVTGSVAFGALPRVVFGSAKDKADPEDRRRVFVRAKCNIGPDGGGFAYELIGAEVTGGIRTSAVRWIEPLDGEARDILAQAEPGDDQEEKSALDEAKDFLYAALASGGVSRNRIRADATGAGIAWRTVERAKKSLGVAHRKEGMHGGFVWFLPANSANPPNLADFTNSAKDAELRQEIDPQKVGGLREIGRTSEGADDANPADLERF